MAGKTKKLRTVKQLLLLRLHRQGVSNRKTAEELGIYKGTANRYVQAFGQSVEDLLKLEEPIPGGDVQCGIPRLPPGEV